MPTDSILLLYRCLITTSICWLLEEDDSFCDSRQPDQSVLLENGYQKMAGGGSEDQGGHGKTP